MRKFVKWSILTVVLLLCVTGIGLGIYFASVWNSVSRLNLNEDKLTSPSLVIEVFDSENKPIQEKNMFNGKYVKSSIIPSHTKDAFVSIEDKTFYDHHGVNYKRIAKAVMNNVKSGNLKEGASTISQQLIKNTHLTSEKTFERKIKEIALTQKLEKRFSKDEILEQYLNIIYFGNNCYGIESAANYYFSKNSHDLALEESATLAGMIKSPNRYSPVLHYERCLTRRNLVLDEMAKDGKISLQESLTAKNKPIELKLNTSKQNRINSYSQAAIDEASSILGIPAKQIALQGYKIYTYQNETKQKDLESAIESVDLGENDHAGIVLDNQKHAVVAYSGKSAYKVLDAKRQPGSCIKPILVYGPALNEDIIYPATQLLDEKTTIAGYSPKNVGGNFKGYVSAREALSKSINIPAVKVLSYVGIDKAKAYATELGIDFDEKDDNYALALGGMHYGTNLLKLTGAYTAFANQGKFAAPKFISFITDAKDKLVYIHHPAEKQVLREDASYLMTDMLKTCASSGTARKLSDLNMDLASKTGTVGKPNSKLNLDAWNVTYSPDYTCGIWVGNLDNTPMTIVGGNEPTRIAKAYFEAQPTENTFQSPDAIVNMPIDMTELSENHRIILANNFTPERYTKTELFTRFNLPNDVSKKFTEIEPLQYKSKVIGSKAFITLQAKEYLKYEIYENAVKSKNLLKTVEGENNNITLEFNMDKERKQFYIVASFIGAKDSITRTESLELLYQPTHAGNGQKWYI